ncbi:MAG: oligosaccharide flippase family protein [Clostridia bacterium]|nr:oligosaccharide flippase family protein [Clostridia bacterium]
MTQKRLSFFKNALLLGIVGLAIRTVQLFLSAYISRTAGAESVGLYSLIMTAYGFALTFATSGISLTVTRLVAGAVSGSGGREASRILRGAFAYALLFSGIATVALLLLGGFIGVSILGDSRSVTALRILSLTLIPSAVSSVVGGYFVAIRRVSLNATVQVTTQAVRILLTILLLSAFSTGAESSVVALAYGALITELVGAALSLIEYAISRRGTERAQGAAFGSVASMAFPLATSAIIRSALLTVEHTLIPRRLVHRGESLSDALAAYGTLHGMAMPLLLYPMAPLSSTCGLLVPEFAEGETLGERGRLRKIASEALTRALSYAVTLATVIALFSEELAQVIFSSPDAGYFISFLAPVLPLMYLDHTADSMLKGIGEHIYSMWVNIADACISILLVYILLPPMGIMGYAVVILVMEGFNFILSALRLYKKIGFRLNLAEGLISPLALSLSACAVTSHLFVFSSSPAPLSLVLKLIFTTSLILGGKSLFDLFSALLCRIIKGKGRKATDSDK